MSLAVDKPMVDAWSESNTSLAAKEI
jgi:hypothetical protein